MTTPENADSVELNENSLQANESHKSNKILNNNNFAKKVNEYVDNKNIESASEISNTHTHPTHAPSTTSSSSSISSLCSDSSSYPIPKHPFPAYGYPYPYPWYPPVAMPANNGTDAYPPAWPYAYNMPPRPPPSSSQTPTNEHPAYPPGPYAYYYPYYPPPPPPPTHSAQHSYMHTPHRNTQTPNDFDSQNAYHDPVQCAYPAYVPPYPYPYPVAPSYGGSTSSSRASSVLPDIIVTPSTDDMPSQVILKHHIKVEKPEPAKRSDAVQIEEVSLGSDDSVKAPPIRREQREGSYIDALTQRLAHMSKIVEHNLNMSKDVEKTYAGERNKEFGEKSPTDNASPVPVPIVTLASETEVSSDSLDGSSDDEGDSDATPKCVETTGLQAIKSVTNIQMYKERKIQTIELDDEDDVTTADGESDIFDEDDNEEDVAEELELDEYIEENDDIDYDNLSVIYEEESEMERSSEKQNTIIRCEGSNNSDATAVEKEETLEGQIEENDNNDDADEDSTSVTVRLPLKFSFNHDNVATVEVGKSQIEERRHSITSESKRSAAFVVADVKNEDSEDEAAAATHEYDDDCEVSVTISLSGSSRSASLERKPEARRLSDAYPIEELPTPEPPSELTATSKEDISFSFSLNARNKFMAQTKVDDVTNNIAAFTRNETKAETLKNAALREEIKEPDIHSKKQLNLMKEKTDFEKETVTQVIPSDDLDFFATLRATKLQAQKMMEQSANYWGKVAEKPVATETEKPKEEEKKEESNATNPTSASIEAEPEVDDIWAGRDEDDLPKPVPKLKLADAKDNFWSTFAAATRKTHEETQAPDFTVNKGIDNEIQSKKEPIAMVLDDEKEIAAEAEAEEIDFWAEIEKSKQSSVSVTKSHAKTNTEMAAYSKPESKVATDLKRKRLDEVTYQPLISNSKMEILPAACQAELYTPPIEELAYEDSSESEESDSEDEVHNEKVKVVSSAVVEKKEEEQEEEEEEEEDKALKRMGKGKEKY
uniref:Uncharacterized protein n=1 Tax=Ceratitis capitata TaxID=7213 RepID=W8AKC7_CERCA